MSAPPYWLVVQLVEHLTVNQVVVGSSPTESANFGLFVYRIGYHTVTVKRWVQFPYKPPLITI